MTQCSACGKESQGGVLISNFFFCNDHSDIGFGFYKYSDDKVKQFAKKHKLCYFDEAWIGICGEPAIENSMCEKHSQQKCSYCGEQATHNCDHASSLVCGRPLCDKHICTTHY